MCTKCSKVSILCSVLIFLALSCIDPAQPVAFSQCGPPGLPSDAGAFNKVGHCTDPRTFAKSGTCCGRCGAAGPVFWTYFGGVCDNTGQGSGGSVPNCFEAETPWIYQHNYKSVAVGTVAAALCSTMYMACLPYPTCLLICLEDQCGPTTTIACPGTTCFTDCLGFPFTSPPYCLCTLAECMTVCTYVNTVTVGTPRAVCRS